ncbi:MAG: hypothetical protein NZZ41_00045 [Candidatus Dojkabacteria bacterium]|nr:hypothetical protein [Candidatus Dojkabacteria bacterium]
MLKKNTQTNKNNNENNTKKNNKHNKVMNDNKNKTILFKNIKDAEDYLRNKTQNMKKRINEKWVGYLVEAVPEGYLVYYEHNSSLFLNKIEDQKIRHWA